MRKLLLRWVWLAVAVVVASLLTRLLGLDFRVEYGSVHQVIHLFIGVAILSLANATLGRLLKFFTIPLNCLTLGLFSLFINGFVLFLVAKLEYGFSVHGSIGSELLAAFVASLLISAINGALRTILPEDNKDD
jgi:putative membrane protein